MTSGVFGDATGEMLSPDPLFLPITISNISNLRSDKCVDSLLRSRLDSTVWRAGRGERPGLAAERRQEPRLNFAF